MEASWADTTPETGLETGSSGDAEMPGENESPSGSTGDSGTTVVSGFVPRSVEPGSDGDATGTL